MFPSLLPCKKIQTYAQICLFSPKHVSKTEETMSTENRRSRQRDGSSATTQVYRPRRGHQTCMFTHCLSEEEGGGGGGIRIGRQVMPLTRECLQLLSQPCLSKMLPKGIVEEACLCLRRNGGRCGGGVLHNAWKVLRDRKEKEQEKARLPTKTAGVAGVLLPMKQRPP